MKVPAEVFWHKLLKKDFMPFLFTLPLILILSILVIYPITDNFFLSFSKLEGSFYQRRFIGFDNYLRLFRDSVFWQAMKNTLLYVCLTVLFGFLLGFLSALVLNQQFRGRAFFRVAIMVSWIVPLIVSASVWKWLYQSDYGIMNDILRRLSLSKLCRSWLSDPDTALFSIAVAAIWQVYPFAALIFLTGMQSIDKNLYDASQVDGANHWQQLLFITLPCLSPVTKIVLFILLLWGLNAMTLVYVMTGGGPANSTIITALYIYQKSFGFSRFEVAASCSVVLFIIALAFITPYVTLTTTEEKE